MNISDILRISIVGLSTFGMIHLARQDKHASRNNPRTKTTPTDAEIAQAKSLLAQTPQVIVDTIVLEKSKDLTSKQISMLIGYTTQQVWDIIHALELLGLIEVKKYSEKSKKKNFDFFKRLHDIYMGPGEPSIRDLAKIADISEQRIRRHFKNLNLPIARMHVDEYNNEQTRNLFKEYIGPNIPTLAALAESVNVSESTLSRRFKALGLPAMIYGRTSARSFKTRNPSVTIDQLYSDFNNLSIPPLELCHKYNFTNLDPLTQTLEYYEYPINKARCRQSIVRAAFLEKEIVEKYKQGLSIYDLYESFQGSVSIPVIIGIANKSDIIFRDTEPVIQYYLQGYSISRIRLLTKLAYGFDTIRYILQNVGLLPSKDSDTTKSVRQVIAPPPPKTSEELELEKSLPLVSQGLVHRIPKEKILELKQKGLNFTQMSKELGISSPTLDGLRRYYDIK